MPYWEAVRVGIPLVAAGKLTVFSKNGELPAVTPWKDVVFEFPTKLAGTGMDKTWFNGILVRERCASN
jgi:hypothetical protein